MLRTLACTVALTCVVASSALAQTDPAFRVQLHAGGEASLRTRLVWAIEAALRPIRDVDVVPQDADYIVSAVTLPAPGSSLVMSLVVLNVHTERSLTNLAIVWNLEGEARDRLRATFRGSGALLDQRILTGTSIEALAGDVARILNADILQPLRRNP